MSELLVAFAELLKVRLKRVVFGVLESDVAQSVHAFTCQSCLRRVCCCAPCPIAAPLEPVSALLLANSDDIEGALSPCFGSTRNSRPKDGVQGDREASDSTRVACCQSYAQDAAV